jgi:hypothetical protein
MGPEWIKIPAYPFKSKMYTREICLVWARLSLYSIVLYVEEGEDEEAFQALKKVNRDFVDSKSLHQVDFWKEIL